MSLPSTNRRKGSDGSHPEKSKSTNKHNETKSGMQDKTETHEHMHMTKKSDMPVFMNAHRKSDADKSVHIETQEKTGHAASGDSYVHESNEFAGVTIIFRTATNPKVFSNLETHGKIGSRRKSEFPHPPMNFQDKFDHGDKTDHTGTNYPIFAGKSDSSTNHGNDISGSDAHN